MADVLLQGKCCICNQEVKSMYSSIRHLENGKTRFYNGHKYCLCVLDRRLAEGIQVEYEEIDTPQPNSRQVSQKK